MPESEADRQRYARSPSDLLRLVVYLVASFGLLALTHWATDSITGFERDLLALVDFLNGGAVRILGGAAQLLLLVVDVGVLVVPLATRRFRLFGYVLLADVAAAALMSAAVWWLDLGTPADAVNLLARRAGGDVDNILTSTTVATTVAVLVVLAPFVTRRWRRAGAAITATLVVLRVVLAVHLPAEVFLGLTIGAACGAGVLLAFGRPDQRPSLAFASKLAPASVGGMALNVRYLQKAGVEPPVAVSAVGLNSAGGFVTHMLMLLVFAVWAGRSAFGSIHLPDPKVLLYGLGVVLAVAIVTFAIPGVRRAVAGRMAGVLRSAVGGVAAVLHRPSKVALLLGGSAVVTGSYIVAIYLATKAFGGDLDFAQVGAIYLAGAAVASAAPTPGGLGALEAALIAGLVAAGMDNTVAVPSVFMYRLATFWLPILPGWFCFSYLRRAEYI